MSRVLATNPVRSAPNLADAKLRVTSGDGLELLVVAYEGEEQLGRLFSFTIRAAVELDVVDRIPEASLVGERAALVMMSSPGRRRCVRGLISDCEFAGLGHKHAYYKLTLSPTVWPLTQRVNCRVFQDQSTPQIIAKVLEDHSFSVLDFHFALKEKYKPRNYCVQYRESDWDFISRLMEEEGMYCFYREKDGRAVLHVADGPHGHFDVEFGRSVRFHPPRVGPPDADSVIDFHARRQVRPGRLTQHDYAAVKPSMPLDTQAVAEAGGAEVFEYPGEYRDKELGNRLAAVRLQELRTGRDQCAGRSLRMDFAPGHRFQLGEHPIGRFNRGFLITRVKHRCVTPMAAEVGYGGAGDVEDDAGRKIRPSYENEFTGIPEDQPFRLSRTTPRPRMAGPQTAVVVGPRGEEIHTDKYGRVRVRFRWDRAEQLARDARAESDSSCWIRVSQPWAGGGYGGLTIPRIGQEVIVDFLEGDPDQPIITGRVYNGESMPPQNLPKEKVRTTIRSQTHKGAGFNEITMDDTTGKEHFYEKAQYDKTVAIGNNRNTSVGVDSTEVVGNNVTESVGNNMSTDVTNAYSVNCDTMLINAKTSITLQCGASRIHMNQAGFISITGTVITSAATVNNSMVAPMTEVVGAVMLSQAGAVVLIEGGATHVRGEVLAALKGAEVNVVAGADNVIQGEKVKIN